jgi:methylmalonyl-CoA/ethylmalonyl-CoA epimerase
VGSIRIKRIDHVAICVPDIDEAAAKWRAVLGLEATSREVVASQKTDAALLPVGGQGDGGGGGGGAGGGDATGTCIELISPKGNEGLERFLEKRGPGLHHVAVEVEGIEGAIALLEGLGVPMIDKVPRAGARGHKVAFVHPRATGGVLIELVEPDHHS